MVHRVPGACRYCVLVIGLILFAAASVCAQEADLLSVSVGVSPTTMGTLGESIAVDVRPVPAVTIGVEGRHEKVFQHDLSYEKLGGPLRGDVSKDLLFGSVYAGVRATAGPVSIAGRVALFAHRSTTASLARIITEVDGDRDPFPQDTEAFIDIDETETLLGPEVGVRIAVAGLPISLGASYVPVLGARMNGGFFQNSADWPNPSTNTYPAFAIYLWREHEFETSGRGTRLSVDGRAGFRIRALDIGVAALGVYRLTSYEGTTTMTNTWSYPYRDAPSDYTTIITTTGEPAQATVAVTDRSLEVGVSVVAYLLERLLNLAETPGVDVSYVRVSRALTLSYLDALEGESERWVEDYSYVRFGVTFGL